MNTCHFKYLKSEHLDAMLNRGKIRIGTLYEYRKAEMPDEVRDEQEGRAMAFTNIPHRTTTQNAPLPGVAREIFDLGPNIELIVEDIKFEQDGQVPNTYIYCLSTEASLAALNRYEYDYCVEILNIVAFGEYLAEALFLSGRITNWNVNVKPCEYRDRVLEVNSDNDYNNIYWLKENRFAHQKEVRLVCPPLPQNPIAIPVIIEIPKIAKVLKLVNF